MSRVPVSRSVAAVVAASGLLVVASCGGDGDDPGDATRSLTIYNAQHEQLLREIAPGFTAETGIEVRLRNGDDFELANQLVQEGDASPADVFLTENSPAMSLVDSKDLFAGVDRATLEQVPPQYSPSDGNWMGFAARSTVLVYNTDAVTADQLPTSIMELADPAWKGRISFSPSGADFQAIVSAVVDLEGEQAAAAWLGGLKENGIVYQGNNVVLNSVDAGQVDVGVIFHYYWYRDRAESGANSDSSRLHYFGNQDPGAFLSVSGAGVLKSSDRQKEAQQFLRYLSGPQGQQVLADSYALEYPLNPAVDTPDALVPLEELGAPTVDIATLNGPTVIELMQNADLL